MSPSHNSESISLYKDYCHYLSRLTDDKGRKLKNEFKGFISNRFGRVGELSHSVCKHISNIRRFFEEYINENSNKLVLAVDSYIESEWFLTCCEIASMFYQDITITIKRVIGIDQFKDTHSDKRTWVGIKEEFEQIIQKLEVTVQAPSTSGKDQLIAKAALNIRDAIRRQLNKVQYFRDKENKEDMNAPMINLGCEGVFLGFGNDCKQAGGSTSLQTISNKSMISNNKLCKKSPPCSHFHRKNVSHITDSY